MANLRRINQEDLRNHNLSVTLDTLLRAQKPMSRADLAKETGLTKATLSLLASMLIESGVVQEASRSFPPHMGGPARRWRFMADPSPASACRSTPMVTVAWHSI